MAKKQAQDEPRKNDEALRVGGAYVRGDVVVDANGKVLEDWAVDSDGNAVQVGAPASDSGNASK